MKYYDSLYKEEITDAQEFLARHTEAVVNVEKDYISSPYIQDMENRDSNVILPLNLCRDLNLPTEDVNTEPTEDVNTEPTEDVNTEPTE